MLKKTIRFALKSVVTLALIGVLVAIFSALALIIYLTTDKNLNVNELTAMAKAQDRSTKLYYTVTDEHNKIIAKELEDETLYQTQNREWVRYEDIPNDLINAFVAIEDHRFFTHGGIDIKRTAGAILGFINGNTSYGGSTITQQLIKNITGEDQYSVSRKIREMIKAYKLDKNLDKKEILELYLNTIYLSKNSYGIQVASKTYFDKDVGELTLTECAALACIPQSPTKWDPISHPENNRLRRRTVLERMNELGMINAQELEHALSEELIIANDLTRNTENDEFHSWYTETVIDDCIQLLMKNGIATSRQTASKLLYTGGLSIITAQNPKMQKALENYFENESNFYPNGDLIHPECSMIVMDPKSGKILAIAGSIGKKTANRTLNYATQTHRSPGSSIKPLSVYAPAIEKGCINFATVIDDTPLKFVSNGQGGMRGWPNNSPKVYRGLTTIRDAVARSANTVALKLIARVGKEESFLLLHDGMNIKSLVSASDKKGVSYSDLSDSCLALGQLTKGVTLREMTSAYTSLANGGCFSDGKTVLKILDADGNVLVDNETPQKRVFSEQTAYIMTKLLMGVTENGTASKLGLKKQFECAGKTGTTSGDCDKWFIGYTADLLAGVWLGFPTPQSLVKYGSDNNCHVKTFDNVMQIINSAECLGSNPQVRFEPVEGVISAKYCRDSGKLLSSACMCDPRGCRAQIGYFTKDTLPTQYCDTHKLVLYDTVNKGVATHYCPKENLRYVGLLDVNRSFAYDVTISDSQYTCHSISEHNFCFDPSKPYFYGSVSYGGKSDTASPYNCACSICYKNATAVPKEDQAEIQDPSEKDEEESPALKHT